MSCVVSLGLLFSLDSNWRLFFLPLIVILKPFLLSPFPKVSYFLKLMVIVFEVLVHVDDLNLSGIYLCALYTLLNDDELPFQLRALVVG